MTDPMLELAERNRREAGVENMRFLKGIIAAIPLPDNSVDVVTSNCVINLSADKGQVQRKAYPFTGCIDSEIEVTSRSVKSTLIL